MTMVGDLPLYLKEWAACLESEGFKPQAKDCRKMIEALRKEKDRYSEDTVRIEVDFPVRVNINGTLFQELVGVITKICDEYEERHPDRVMWPAGMGSKILYMPMTAEEEKTQGMKFSDDVLQISCAERANYQAKCAKCGMEQGDHKGHIIDPPAGECEFTLTSS